MWKNMVQPERLMMTPWCMRIACWISKATYTREHAGAYALMHAHTHLHSLTIRMCNTHCFSTAKMVARTPVSVTFIRILRVFVITANACLPLPTVTSLVMFSLLSLRTPVFHYLQ